MASLSPYSITLGATDYPVKYAGLLAYIEPYLTNLETFTFSGGNVGLGVTPSAWGTAASRKAMQYGFLGGASVFTSGAGNTLSSFVHGAYENGTNWLYAASGIAAARYEMTGANAGSTHAWYVSAGGTAGNTISFTQAMTLDASGNLDLGTTGGVDRYQNIIATSAKLTFNAGTGFTGSAATSIYNQSAIALVFGTNNLERARISSGGDLLVGTTTASASDTSNGLVCDGTNPGYVISRRSSGASQTHLEFRNGGTNVGNISSSTTATAYNTSSDRRLKDNITPAPSASAVIDAIEIVSHDWKSAPDEHVTYGVIAQDLALVAPQAVLQGDDGEEIEKTWGVDYSKLVPMLIKEIQTLRARVAALEAA